MKTGRILLVAWVLSFLFGCGQDGSSSGTLKDGIESRYFAGEPDFILVTGPTEEIQEEIRWEFRNWGRIQTYVAKACAEQEGEAVCQDLFLGYAELLREDGLLAGLKPGPGLVGRSGALKYYDMTAEHWCYAMLTPAEWASSGPDPCGFDEFSDATAGALSSTWTEAGTDEGQEWTPVLSASILATCVLTRPIWPPFCDQAAEFWRDKAAGGWEMLGTLWRSIVDSDDRQPSCQDVILDSKLVKPAQLRDGRFLRITPGTNGFDWLSLFEAHVHTPSFEYTSPEMVLLLTWFPAGQLTIKLPGKDEQELSQDLDLFVYDELCTAGGLPGGTNAVSFMVEEGKSYHVVIDSYTRGGRTSELNLESFDLEFEYSDKPAG